MSDFKQLTIKLAPIYQPIWKKKRLKAFFGGRGAARTHSVARYLLRRSMTEKIRIWCAREIQDAIWQSVHHVFCELIELYKLNEYFKITDNDITCKLTNSYFMFKGFRGNGGQYSEERLKAYEDFDVLWIEEASACTMKSLLVVSKTIRKEGSEIIATFNRVLEDDAIWRFACYDVGDIYNNKYYEDDNRIVIYATVDDNPYASDTLLQERETDRKRLDPDEFRMVWLGYPDRSGGYKALIPRDIIYRETVAPDFSEYSKFEVICGFDPSGGKDSACAIARQGRKILATKVYHGIKDPYELANLFIEFKQEWKADRAYCDKGYGQGVLAIATQLGEIIFPVDFGGRPIRDGFANKRAEMYSRVKSWLIDGGCLSDTKDEDRVRLKRELSLIEIDLRKSDDGKLTLVSKDLIREKLNGKSPDIADALALTFAGHNDRIVKDRYGQPLTENSGYSVRSFEGIDTLNLL